MTGKKITRRDFETKPLAALARDHSNETILAALARYRVPASKRRRPKHNQGNLRAVWVAVEWKRGQSKGGGRYSVKRACELLAEQSKGIEPGSDNVAPIPGWSRLRALHAAAEALAKTDSEFRKRLSADQEHARSVHWPDDHLIPLFVIGGSELPLWGCFSAHAELKK